MATEGDYELVCEEVRYRDCCFRHIATKWAWIWLRILAQSELDRAMVLMITRRVRVPRSVIPFALA